VADDEFILGIGQAFQADFFLRPEVAIFILPVALYALRRGPSAGLALFRI